MKKTLMVYLILLLFGGDGAAQTGWFVQSPFTSMNLYDVKQTAVFALYAASDNGSVFKSTDNGLNWVRYDFNDPLLNNISFKYVYGGNNDDWVVVGQETGCGYKSGLVDSVLRISPSPPQPVLEAYTYLQGFFFYAAGVAAGDGGNFYIKDMTNWRKDTAATAVAGGVNINYCRQSLFVGDNGLIMKADSIGLMFPNGERIKWRILPSGTTKNLYCIAGGGVNFIAVGEDGTIIKTTDFGESWQSISSPVTEDLYGVTLNYRNLICGANGTILKSDILNSDIWGTQASPTTEDLYSVITLGYQEYIAMGANGILLRTTDGGVGIHQISNEVPEQFNLEQNFPNPFNPVTKIRFNVSSNGRGQASDVKLIIYNALGEEVTILVNEKLSPGTYEAEFNGVNLPSGIYFYRLETAGFSRVKKMIMTK